MENIDYIDDGNKSLDYFKEITKKESTPITKSLIYQLMEKCKILANINRDNWSDEDNETYVECIVQYMNKYGYNLDTARTAIDKMINSYIPNFSK